MTSDTTVKDSPDSDTKLFGIYLQDEITFDNNEKWELIPGIRFDSYDLNSDAQQRLQDQAAWLKQYSDVSITVEGHCDERGTREYNIALGERRAQAMKNYLIGLAGTPTTISPGLTSFTTAAPTPTTEPSPNRTPGFIDAPTPIDT